MNTTRHGPRPVRNADHGIVFRDENAFSGWPYYCGLWRTADGSILAAFKRIPVGYSNAAEISHDRLTVGLGKLMSLRSCDEGETFDRSTLSEIFDLSTTADQIAANGRQDYLDEPPFDFRDPDTLLMCGGIPALFSGKTRPWMRVSTDGGRSWRPPILLPLCGFQALSGISSILTRRDGRTLLFLNYVVGEDKVRRPVVFADPDGGGRSWAFLSMIVPKEEDGAADSTWTGSPRFGGFRWYYARAIELPDGGIIAVVRCQRDPTGLIWTEIFRSDDGGLTWRFLSRLNDWGAPTDIIRMSDGRIACIYGYRVPPRGVRARFSEDDGRSWGPEWIIRDDGGSWDLGYPRVIELSPGRLLTTYYINLKDDPVQMNGGVRHIARTIFSVD